MFLLPTAPKYSLRQSSFLAVTQSLLELLTSIKDTRAILICSSEPDLSLLSIYPELSNLAVKDEGISYSPSLLNKINSSIPTNANFYYHKQILVPLGVRDAQEGENHDKVCSSERHTGKSWFPCCLNLEQLLVTTATSNQIDQTPGLVILGVGDRFNVLLIAKAVPLRGQQLAQEKRVQVDWIFDPDSVATFCNKLQHHLGETPETLTAFQQSLSGWLVKPNHPSLQSELTLHLLAAIDTDVREQRSSEAEKRIELNSPRLLRPSTPLPFGSPWQQQQCYQPERLLIELLRMNRSTQSTQMILRQSAALIRESFGVSRCVIAFYRARDHHVTWGAIAHGPKIPVSSRQTHYPDWEAVEKSIQSTDRTSPWSTDANLWNSTGEEKSGSQAAQSCFTWIVPIHNNPLEMQTSFYGLLVVEQWEFEDRIWQIGEMQLLNLALQQVQQSLEAANLYQQAEERAQHAALLNRLVDQIRASLELPHIFETVARELGNLLVADRCAILQYVEAEKVWQPVTEYRAHTDIPTAIDLIIPDENNPVISQLHNLYTVQVSDTSTLEDPLNQSLAEKYPGSWLMVPIHRQGKIWGCLSFAQDKYPRYWHQSELKFIDTVADQLAIAIYQATLYQQIQQQNQNLESLVQERTRELESFFDAHPDSICVIERISDHQAVLKESGGLQALSLRLRFCNNAFAHSMGIENQQQVEGLPILECFPSKVAHSFVKQNCFVFESGQTLHEQETLVLADGIHHFDAFRVPLKHANGEVYACLGTSRDITELVQIKQALSERTEQLQEALSAAHAASQAKSQFLATMSHELRTPLTAVIGMSSALLKQFFGQVNLKQAEYLQIIHDSGKHLLHLINDILDLSKIEAGKASLSISQFSLQEVAHSSLALLWEKAQGQKIKLVSELSGLSPHDAFYGDERRIKQILLNLLSNAVKFTPSGGQVCLSMQYDGQTAVIEVADTGIGIPFEKQHLLFEAFQQIDSLQNRIHEGTGLGLALTRQLVEMHGGTIEFDSTIGVGTVFKVYLPAQPMGLGIGD